MVGLEPHRTALPLLLRLFGPFEVRLNGDPLPRLRSRKGYQLLALLAVRHDCEVARPWLAGMLWPDYAASDTLESLRKSLKDLRRALGPASERLGSLRPHTLSLALTEAEADVVAFDAAIARGDDGSLEQAVALYRGPLLEGWAEEWVFEEREKREQAYFAALERLAERATTEGDAASAVRYLRQVVAAEPLRETAQRALMAALAAQGSYAAVIESYRDLRLLLHRELNTEPAPETSALFQQLRAESRAVAARPSFHHGDTETRRTTEGEKGRRGEGVIGEETRACQADELLSPLHPFTPSPLHPVASSQGGAVPLDSEFYVIRRTDAAFHAAIARQDSLVLLKGAAQMGKTSLLGRGLHQAREAGVNVVFTDFQTLNAAHLASADALFLALAEGFADQLALEVLPEEVWNLRRGASMNFEWYLRREVLGKLAAPVVWGLDEVDRLFPCDLGGEVFRLFRSWHNRRLLEPAGPWARLTLAMAYATEAHLFITDLNQSPFNVGTRLALEDFTLDEVADLNRRHGSPLQDEAEVARFYALVSGQPDLVSRGLSEMAAQDIGIAELGVQAKRDERIFGDHLRQILVALARDPDLSDVMRGVLQGKPCPTPQSFYRLRSAGVLAGESARDARPRCQLYATYLAEHLG